YCEYVQYAARKRYRRRVSQGPDRCGSVRSLLAEARFLGGQFLVDGGRTCVRGCMLVLRTCRRRTALACCDPPAAVAEDCDAPGLYAHYVRRVFERRATAGDPDLHELAVPPVHHPPQPAGPGWLCRAWQAGYDAVDQHAADGDDGGNSAGGHTPRISFGK